MASSVIAAVGYDDTSGLLEVEFHTGRIYYYLSVPPEVFEELLAADSVGGYFNENIRKDYKAIRVQRGRRS